MHVVRRAIIMAAGFGKRMNPITSNTPKPLIRIKGVRMIDTIILGLKKNGIEEIYVVVGYLREQFGCLVDEYGVKLIDNPLYSSSNNISSLYFAREYLENSIIIDGDQIIYNEKVLSPYFEKSCYNAVSISDETKEWVLQVRNGSVVSCSRTGGTNGWQLYSISRWTGEDGRRLRAHLEDDFVGNENSQLYWDDVVLFRHFSDYDLGVFPMSKNDVVEIDDYSELVRIDSSYRFIK